MWQVEVDTDKCSGDEECVNACLSQVFEMTDGKADPVNVDECLGVRPVLKFAPKAPLL